MSSSRPSPSSSTTKDFDASTELSSRRTGMSFQRTRLSADRTLMSVMRTSLSLIGFGFTVFQFFQKLQASEVVSRSTSPGHFGQTLVWLGIGMLTVGIVYHALFMLGLRRERRRMKDAGLLHAESGFPVSLTLITAVLLLALGVVAIAGMSFNIGPLAN
jgi:putative membrane protein